MKVLKNILIILFSVVRCGSANSDATLSSPHSIWSKYQEWAHLWDHRSLIVQVRPHYPRSLIQNTLHTWQKEPISIQWKILSEDKDWVLRLSSLTRWTHVSSFQEWWAHHHQEWIQNIEPDLFNEILNTSYTQGKTMYETLRQIRWPETMQEILKKQDVNPEIQVIAVLDTGVDILHPKFRSSDPSQNTFDAIYHQINSKGQKEYLGFNPNLQKELTPSTRLDDFAEVGGAGKSCPPVIKTAPRTRDCGHGTHIAGIIAARPEGDPTIVGICPFCQVFPIRLSYTVYNEQIKNLENSFIRDSSVIQALAFMRHFLKPDGKPIIQLANMSFGKYVYSQIIAREIEKTTKLGIGLIAAGGNDNSFRPIYPANFPGVLSVGATQWISDTNQKKADFSNYFYTDVMAPGVLIRSLSPGSKAKLLSGTSQAAPIVTASVALLMSVKKWDSRTAIQKILAHANPKMVYGHAPMHYRVDEENRNSFDFGTGFLDILASYQEKELSEVYTNVEKEKELRKEASYDGCVMKVRETNEDDIHVNLNGLLNPYIFFWLFLQIYQKKRPKDR